MQAAKQDNNGFDLPEIDPRFDPLIPLDSHADDIEADKRLMTRFMTRPVMNPLKSTEQGRAIYDEIDYIEIRTPGNQLSVICAPVKEYLPRFQDRYNAWKKNEGEALAGTPLEAFPYLLGKVGMIAELHHMNIRTVEQLAHLADSYVQKIMGGNALRDMAKSYIDETQGPGAVMAKLAKDNEAMAAQMAVMQQQLQQMQEKAQASESGSKTPKKIQSQVMGASSLPLPADMQNGE